MHIREIIGETAEPETWETRHARFRRQQAKQAKLRAKVDNAQAQAAEQNRRAAAARQRASAKLTFAKRELARTPTR